jgi:hypothetical protein
VRSATATRSPAARTRCSRVAGAAHFLQEDQGERLAHVVVEWLRGLDVLTT